jgi:hypothetical protein
MVPVRRLQLFEMSDSRWCPQSVRAIVTDYIQFGVRKWKMDVEMAALLRRVFEHLGVRQVIDLCSGSGGPWVSILQALEDGGPPVKVCLTDKYPNVQAFKYAQGASDGKFDFCAEPVDAAHVPRALVGFRTIFSGFHHFRPPEARAILRNAVNCHQGIAIFEITHRTPWSMLNFTGTALLIPFCVPFFRPFRWSRLLWTYLAPVAPVVNLFDSLVSCLRTYSVQELKELATGIDANDYIWEAGEIKPPHSLVPITYLVGYPGDRL